MSIYKVLSQEAALRANAAAVQAAQSAVQALINSSRTGRSDSEVSDCSEVVIVTRRLTELALNFPSSPYISVLSDQITSAPSIICSTEELDSLTALEEVFEDAIANIAEALEDIQEQLALTGNTDSAESTTDTTSIDTTKIIDTTKNIDTTTITESCGNCVFPFIFSGGILINKCTRIDGDTQPWCFTSVDGLDEEGSLAMWEYCTDPSCPGLESCGNCIFPFYFGENLIETCTTIDGDTEAWCATSVEGGQMVTWEYCTEPTCPVEGNRREKGNRGEMSVHPENAVGNCCKFFRWIKSKNFKKFFLDCGIPNRAESVKRIVGGLRTEVGEYPWQVHMYI